MGFHFSLNFEDLGYFNRARMRTKEFSASLATARGPHASSLCIQTAQSIYGLIDHTLQFTSIIHMLISNSGRNPVSYGHPSDLVRAVAAHRSRGSKLAFTDQFSQE